MNESLKKILDGASIQDVLSEQGEEETAAREGIGSGKLPNKYYVSGASDFYAMEERGHYNWASDNHDVGNEYKTYGVFDTYAEALAKAREVADQEFGNEPVKDGINTIAIDDHLSGQIYTIGWYAHKNKSESILGSGEIWTYEIEEYEDTKFTEDEMEKQGVEFK